MLLRVTIINALDTSVMISSVAIDPAFSISFSPVPNIRGVSPNMKSIIHSKVHINNEMIKAWISETYPEQAGNDVIIREDM